MNRLVDRAHSPGSAEQLLAEGIRATPRIDPAPPPIRDLLARGGASQTSRRAALLKVAFPVAAVLFGAMAMAGTLVLSHRSPAPQPITVDSAPLPPVEPTASAGFGPGSGQAGDLPSEEPAPPPPAASVVSPAVKAPARGGEDPTLVLQAIRALRQDGDPARASTLLGRYLGAHPRGLLAEDALALSIEAADARHDPGAAASLGRRYLAEYPSGRYRALAQRAVQPSGLVDRQGPSPATR
jgi:hypothetical protein